MTELKIDSLGVAYVGGALMVDLKAPIESYHRLVLTCAEKPYRYSTLGYHRIELGEYESAVVCPGPKYCHGWQECDGDHTGYDPEDEESPAFDQYEDVEIHGVLHEWKCGHNWTVPYKGCVLEGRAWPWGDNVHDILMTYGPGEYVIDEDWDDTDVFVTAAKAGS